MRSSRGAISCRSFRVTGWSSTKIRFFPSRPISRRTTSSSPSTSRPASRRRASTSRSRSKTPETERTSAPSRIASEAARAPARRASESTTSDLPAPVSPVRTFRPRASSTSPPASTARFLTWSRRNTRPALRSSPSAPREVRDVLGVVLRGALGHQEVVEAAAHAAGVLAADLRTAVVDRALPGLEVEELAGGAEELVLLVPEDADAAAVVLGDELGVLLRRLADRDAEVLRQPLEVGR